MEQVAFGPRLPGKVAFITGAGKGQGQAAAKLFAQHGARVAVVDVDRTAAEGTAAEIEAGGGQALAAIGDVGRAIASYPWSSCRR